MSQLQNGMAFFEGRLLVSRYMLHGMGLLQAECQAGLAGAVCSVSC